MDEPRAGSRQAFNSWLVGELLLVALLSAALALWASYPSLPSVFQLSALRVVLDTTIAIAAAIVAVLTGTRLSVDRRRSDLLLTIGFAVSALTIMGFELAPVVAEHSVSGPEAWASLFGRLLSTALFAAAAFREGKVKKPTRALLASSTAALLGMLAIWSMTQGASLPTSSDAGTPALPVLFGCVAVLNLLTMVGFGLRFRRRGEDLDSWLTLAATLWLFASLHFVFKPILPGDRVALGDFLRLTADAFLLVGVWRAIRAAEFGRVVAEERARVAREIHDGLAQYLFALSAHVNMLQAGAQIETVLPRLREAVTLAQQEARFAILALSSAAGSSPFDSAMQRYVEFLMADGALEVDLEIDPTMRLAPDEQIEVFRIVQEGLANVRKHAHAHWAEIRIQQEDGRRLVSVRDDGEGFDENGVARGEGLKNMRQRASGIGAGFTLTSRRGVGTTLEIALRG
ncbi:MAG: sensor histidine kinase [Gaiellaceae bacterium]